MLPMNTDLLAYEIVWDFDFVCLDLSLKWLVESEASRRCSTVDAD